MFMIPSGSEPFDPDERMRRILDQGAKQGAAMCRAIVYASREPDIRYWADRHWERMFLYNTTFERDGVTDIDARTLWHYQAIVVSPNLISTTPSAGTAYLTTLRDKREPMPPRVRPAYEPFSTVTGFVARPKITEM